METDHGNKSSACPCFKLWMDRTSEFGKVVEKENAGLVICRHSIKTEHVTQGNRIVVGATETTENEFIHNTKNTDTTTTEYLPEMEKRKITCARCRKIMERAPKLLQRVPALSGNDITDICDHCRLKKQAYKDSEETIKKFYASKNEVQENTQKWVKEWLSKNKNILKDSFLDEKKSLKRSQSEIRIDQLCRRRKSGTEREPEVRELLHDLLRPGSARTIAVINEGSEKQIDFLVDHPQLGTEDRPSMFGDLSGRKTHIPDEEKISVSSTDFDTVQDFNEQTKHHFAQDYIVFEKTQRLKSRQQNGDNSLSGRQKIQGTHERRKRITREEHLKYETEVSKFKQKGSKTESKEPKSASQETKSERKEPNSVSKQQKVNKKTMMAEFDADKDRKAQDKQKTITAERDEEHKSKDQDKHVKGKATMEEKRTEKEKKDQEKHESTLKAKKLSEIEKMKRDKQGKEKTLKPVKSAQQEKYERENQEKEKQMSQKRKEKDLEKKVEDKLDSKESGVKKEKPSTLIEKQPDVKGHTDTKVSKVNALKNNDEQGMMGMQESKISPKHKNTRLGSNVDKNSIAKDKRQQNSQIRKKNAQDSEEPNISFNKIKVQKSEPNIPISQVKGQPGLKESPQEKINSFLKDDTEKAKQEIALNRKLAKEEKEERALEQKTKQKTTADDKKKMGIQMLKSSKEDLISKLVRLKEQGKPFNGRLSEIMTPFEIKTHMDQHMLIDNAKCPLCIYSDIELDFESRKNKGFEVFEIIRGQKIYKLKSQFIEKHIDEEVSPLLFQSKYDEPTFDVTKAAELAPVDEPKSGKLTKGLAEQDNKGVLRYALSDRTFIEKGWTMLPTEKVVRKMNVYRMRPAQPEFDWFKRNKNKGMMLYDSGERLAEFDDNGRGKWYYRNGRMALDYYEAEESNAQQRFVIYSNGEPDERGRSRPYTILATFDFLGNGIVFDHSGKIRLKYNQTEGVVLDRNIGPVSHWKWHTLNEPPVLQQVMIDTQLTHKDPVILQMGGKGRGSKRPEDEDMLAIEFDNFIKEKSKKLTQSFKPFQIKMKALKINEHFSLKVLDQATIYLIYRDGTTILKLNIGMILDHKEIVDTDTTELGEVSSNLERLPARTDSLAGLQKSVAYAERFERSRTERERRLHPPVPAASADILTAATSHPMCNPLRTVLSSSSTTTGTTGSKYSRKPVSKNVYYDARLA